MTFVRTTTKDRYEMLTENHPRSISAMETAKPSTRVMISGVESETPSRRTNITKLTYKDGNGVNILNTTATK